MPAATNKDDLLSATHAEYRKLLALVERFDAKRAKVSDASGYSAQRIVGHRAAWIDLFFGWCRDADAGITPRMPKAGYLWRNTPELSDEIWAEQRQMTWREIVALLDKKHAAFVEFLEGQDDDALYAKPMSPGLKWTRGRYAEAVGPAHYRSAAKYMRGLLRVLQPN
ncbi:MAG: ClbS/DfsB family four-helix bundle protein [Pseudomonadota bacterium]